MHANAGVIRVSVEGATLGGTPLLLALAWAPLLIAIRSRACERHLNRHLNGSETSLEGSKK